MLKLSTVGFVNTAYIDPEESQLIALGLIFAKLNLYVACFVLSCTVHEVPEEDLPVAPCV